MILLAGKFPLRRPIKTSVDMSSREGRTVCTRIEKPEPVRRPSICAHGTMCNLLLLTIMYTAHRYARSARFHTPQTPHLSCQQRSVPDTDSATGAEIAVRVSKDPPMRVTEEERHRRLAGAPSHGFIRASHTAQQPSAVGEDRGRGIIGSRAERTIPCCQCFVREFCENGQ